MRASALTCSAVAALLAACELAPVTDGMTHVVPPDAQSVAPFFVDKYEATLVNGVARAVAGKVPQNYIDFAEAKQACEKAQKRLCTHAEWLAACAGPGNHRYSFQDAPDKPQPMSSVCWTGNDELYDDQRAGPEPSGKRERCKTAGLDVWDMAGNLSEWVVDSAGVPLAAGPFFALGLEGTMCDVTVVPRNWPTEVERMPPEAKMAAVGFRCCHDAPDAAAQ